jgi:tetratricopeptide (TPR) repeat protein
MTWLRGRELPAAAAELYRAHSATVEASPLLCYQMADLLERARQSAYAGRLVDLADAIMAQSARPRYPFGLQLQRLGLSRPAEIEYRRQLTTSPVDSVESIRARMLLIDLLVDQGRFGEAASLLEPCREQLESAGFRDKFVAAARRTPESALARREFYLAREARQRGDQLQQRIHLLRAVELDPASTDVLIDLHATSGNDPRKKQLADTLIDAALASLDQQIRILVEKLVPESEPSVRHGLEHELSLLENRWAWLASNTGRHPSESLRRSLRALELNPGYAPFADTLARCHWTLGQLSEAVAAARQAVAAEPSCLEFQQNLEAYLKAQKSQSIAGLLEN